jgi:hypothetical protein
MKIETRLKLYRALGLIKAAPKKVSFSQAQPLPRKILLLFPLNEDHVHQCQIVVDQLQEYLDSGRVFYAIADNFRDVFKCPPQYAFYFPVIPDTQYRLRMDVLLARYKGQQFDAVFNLDPLFNLQMARVMSVIRTPRRVGFTGPLADILYNIQIQVKDRNNLEKSYHQMLALCDLEVREQSADAQLSLI